MGVCCIGFGALGVASSTRLWVTLASAVVLGLGYGGTTLAVNVLASELAPGAVRSTVNLVNVFYAAGAIAGPLVAGFFLDRGRPAVSAVWMGVGLVFLLVPVCARAIPGGVLPQHPAPGDAQHPPAGLASSSPAESFCCCTSAAKARPGAWAPVYLQRSAGLDASGAASSTAVFWFALCAGRMLAVLAGMHLPAQRLLVVSLAGSAAGALSLVIGHGTAWMSIAALALLGFSFGRSIPRRSPSSLVASRARRAPRRVVGVLALHRRDAVPLAARPGAHPPQGTTAGSARLTLGTIVVMALMWTRVDHVARAGHPTSLSASSS